MTYAPGDEWPGLPPHRFRIGDEEPRNDFSAAITDRLRLDPARPLHLHYAFGGTSELGSFERPAELAYARMSRGWTEQLHSGQLIVVDGATRAGHILLLEEVMGQLGTAEQGVRHLSSFGIASAAALVEAGTSEAGFGERAGSATALFNQAHAFTAVVDTMEPGADWGFETLFFFDSMAAICRLFRTLAPTEPISVTVSFVNGGEVTAKELAFSSLLLQDMAHKFGAEAEVVVWGGTGRLATKVAEAARDGAGLRVHLLGGAGTVTEVSLQIDHDAVEGRVVNLGVQPRSLVASPATRSVFCARPLNWAEERILSAYVGLGSGRRVKVRVMAG